MILNHIGKSVRPLASCSPHSHENWELVYNEKGAGMMRIDGREYSFREGSIMLYPPGSVHQKVASVHFEDYYVLFSGCDFPRQVYCFSGGQHKDILQLLKIMHGCYHESEQTDICVHLLNAIMGMLAPELNEHVLDKKVQKLRRAMIEGFADADFKIADAMAGIPLNEDHLRRRFKNALGMTPHAYLEWLRIENAKKLLDPSQGADMHIAEAAYLSGFYDPLYFSRVFRQHTGVSPSEWRKKGNR